MAEIIITDALFYECPNCENEVELGQNYCHECGEALVWKEVYE